MNLFYIKNKIFSFLLLVSDNKYSKTKIIDNNYFFYDENDNLVGFNIFDNDITKNINPGRVFVDEQIVEKINKKYGLNLKISNFVNFKIVKINDFIAITNTHLSKCDVQVDKNHNIQIVCGAKNVKKDMLTVLAPIGILMNNGQFIKNSKLQNIESFGMLCSQKELNINGFNEQGIIDLSNKNVNIGDTFIQAYKNDR